MNQMLINTIFGYVVVLNPRITPVVHPQNLFIFSITQFMLQVKGIGTGWFDYIYIMIVGLTCVVGGGRANCGREVGD